MVNKTQTQAERKEKCPFYRELKRDLEISRKDKEGDKKIRACLDGLCSLVGIPCGNGAHRHYHVYLEFASTRAQYNYTPCFKKGECSNCKDYQKWWNKIESRLLNEKTEETLLVYS